MRFPSKRFFLLCLMVGVCILASGCTRTTYTQSTTTLDPAFEGQKYRSILVSAEGMSLAEQQAIEGEAYNLLLENRIEARKGEHIFLPTRRYNDAEKRKLAVKTGMDAVLTIVRTGRQVHHVRTYPDDNFGYGPRVGVGAYGGSSSGVGVGLGFPLGGRRYADEGGFVGGTDFAEPEATYRVELYALPDFQNIWIGEFSVRGPDRMSWPRLGAAFSEQLVKKMQADGVI